jgi:hypothetical protein
MHQQRQFHFLVLTLPKFGHRRMTAIGANNAALRYRKCRYQLELCHRIYVLDGSEQRPHPWNIHHWVSSDSIPQEPTESINGKRKR